MKRLIQVAGVIVAMTLGVMGVGVPAHAATNDFTISNYHMKLELGRDSEQRSTLKTTETIMAQFPSADQSHGIERAIPTTYNGHSTSLAVQSVTDETGAKVAYSTYESNGNEVVRIGDKHT